MSIPMKPPKWHRAKMTSPKRATRKIPSPNFQDELAALKKKQDALGEEAFRIIEAEAHRVLQMHPELNDITIGMGSWSITTKDGDDIDPYNNSEDIDYSDLQPLIDFIMQYDDIYHITGNAVNFYADRTEAY